MLVLKLLLTPVLMIIVYILGRVFGQRIAGIFAAFPIIVGPILMFIFLEKGEDFGKIALFDALGGAVSLVGFTLTFLILIRLFQKKDSMAKLLLSLLSGVIVFCGLWFLLLSLQPSFLAYIVLFFAFLALSTFLTRNLLEKKGELKKRNALVELSFRVGLSLVLVFGVTEAASFLGPENSGFLSPFPTAGSVIFIGGFYGGRSFGAYEAARGYLLGLYGLGTFLMLWYVGLSLLGFGWSFVTAIGLVSVLQLILARVESGRRIR